ncbi:MULTISPECIES: hypothetical protein [Mycobacteriaceae]|uniref:hypothetical protein n=1 Tax=Mycobacteriaceae TaxID=1762 RepID=UPI0014038C2C|nr:hypothetical protein [Mycolicibacter senuensis]
MNFVVTQRISTNNDSGVRRAGRRMIGRLRHLGARSEAGPQQRAERYVAHMPTAVLGAC